MKTSRELYDDMAEGEGIVRATLGMGIIAMLKSGEPISRVSIMSLLDEVAAERRAVPGMNEMLAKGAIRFIAALPQA